MSIIQQCSGAYTAFVIPEILTLSSIKLDNEETAEHLTEEKV